MEHSFVPYPSRNHSNGADRSICGKLDSSLFHILGHTRRVCVACNRILVVGNSSLVTLAQTAQAVNSCHPRHSPKYFSACQRSITHAICVGEPTKAIRRKAIHDSLGGLR